MPRRLLPLFAVFALACTGEVLDDSSSMGANPGGGDGSPGGGSSTRGLTVLHRLNRVELGNTLDDLFGPSARSALPNGSDPHVLGFDTIADVLTVSHSGVDSLVSLAERVTQEISLDGVAPCDGLAERACAEARFDSLATKVLRRPPSSQERESYLTLWEDVRSREEADVASRAMIKRLLISPDFLYHVEIGDPQTGLLTPYELAARLSFLMWETTPDDALLNAAATGALGTREGVREELARLARHDRGREVMRRFFAKWTDFEKLEKATKDPAFYPEFEGLRPAMAEEFHRFVDDILVRDGTIRDLLTSTTSFVDPNLAAFYGVDAPDSGFSKVDLASVGRAGLFTQAAFLSTHGKANKSSPILRGVFVRERLLCAPIPPPPPTANNAPTAPVTTTTREYFATLTAPPACDVCHKEVNPIGFAFEGYDGMGASRTTENDHEIDTSGAITFGDVAGEVADAFDLVHQLATSETVRRCIVTQWFRSRVRRVEASADAPIIDRLTESLAAADDRVNALVTALSEEEAFYRLHFQAEVSR